MCLCFTAQVLLSLKMGALCNADTTDTSEWRLLSSNSFCQNKHTISSFKIIVPDSRSFIIPKNVITKKKKKLTFAILTKWLRISARIFSVCAVKISLTSQKLTWKAKNQSNPCNQCVFWVFFFFACASKISHKLGLLLLRVNTQFSANSCCLLLFRVFFYWDQFHIAHLDLTSSAARSLSRLFPVRRQQLNSLNQKMPSLLLSFVRVCFNISCILGGYW